MVEWASLERMYVRKGIKGSNPFLSAKKMSELASECFLRERATRLLASREGIRRGSPIFSRPRSFSGGVEKMGNLY